jgi:endonuclease-3
LKNKRGNATERKAAGKAVKKTAKKAVKKRANQPARRVTAAAKRVKAARAEGTAIPATRARRGRESREGKRVRVAEIVRRLQREYPDARCSLDFRNPYELLVATILSAQCTDERVNMVTPALFRRYPTAHDLAGARTEELEELIRSTGFFRNKARSLLGMSNAVVDRHQGRIPDDMEDLVDLPGVGRKTANVVLGNAFGKADGVVVDTHVTRLSHRLGLTRQHDAVRIEDELMQIVAREDWIDIAHLFIHHGRAVCRAQKPRCPECVLADLCPSARL